MMNDVPILKIGVLGDVQGLASRHDWGMRNLALALDIFKEKNIDLLLSMGDIAEFGEPETFDLYWELIEERFGKNGIRHFSCEGNHELQKRDCPDFAAAFQNACRGMRCSAELIRHENICGVDFVAFAEDQFGKCKHSDAACEQLDGFLQRFSPGKPVFLLSHHPPAETMAGSYGTAGVRKLREVLDKYPQVISFSGHTHWPLNDECSIWQGGFTAVTTSTLAYACMAESGCDNSLGGLIPYAREGVNILYMELFEDRLEIERIHVLDRHQIGGRWSVSLPFDPENAEYTDLRASTAPVPQFAEDAEFLIRYDFGFWYIGIDRPLPGVCTQYFEVEITPLSYGGDVITASYVSDFHRILKNQEDLLFFRLPGTGIRDDEDYEIAVYPVNSFGKRGRPLKMIEHSWKGYGFKDSTIVCPQE